MSRGTWQGVLAVAAFVAMCGAAAVTLTSNHAKAPVTQAVLTVAVCAVFVGTGLLALRRDPYERFGLLLVGVGVCSLLGPLHDAYGAFLYAVGVLTANLVFAVLAHALLAFPEGRLQPPFARTLVLAAYVDVLVLQAVAVVVDPLTRYHSAHPRNLLLIASHPDLATVLEELEGAIAIGIAVAVCVLLVRRVRGATPAARRQLAPVLASGSAGLCMLGIGLLLAPESADAAIVGIGLGLLAALALPVSFLVLMAQGRMSRLAVGELLVELGGGSAQPGLQAALRRALGDPSLELARRTASGRYVCGDGFPITLPGQGEGRVATAIDHRDEQIGVLVHDRTLCRRPELLEAVTAAAGFALANERALETIRLVEHRSRAILDAIPDPMIRVARDGTYLDVRAEDTSLLLRPPGELIGRNIRDFLPADVAEPVFDCIESALESGSVSAVEYELDVGGRRHRMESRMMPSGAGEVVTIVRDFTEQRRAQLELHRLADEQAALRRVATLVAGDADADEVFQAVTAEACGLLGLHSALLLRYEGPALGMIVGKYGDPADDFLLGADLPLSDGAALTVQRTGAPTLVDYAELEGDLAARMRDRGYRSSIAVPINVSGETWGALVAAFREDEGPPSETVSRLEAFAELVALAVASAHARERLAASRLRIIEAGDAERRRIERNLHDGAQQRLVALSVGLRLIDAKIRDAPAEAGKLVEDASRELSAAIGELRELAQGIHPAVLTDRGLDEALEVLAARTPLPVDLEVRLAERLPPSVEAAAYYVVSESLANVVKHARATAARVRVVRFDGHAMVEVGDDGAGGADPDRGSGLCGLRDRVETLSGHLEIESARGCGTHVRALVPLP
jgi:signal transduction histidine kinase